MKRKKQKNFDEAGESEVPETNSALFETIDTAIRTEQLYANVSLQRQDICTRFCITRHTLNSLLAQYAGSSSFPQYINNIRMEEALPLLRDNPSMTIAAIASLLWASHQPTSVNSLSVSTESPRRNTARVCSPSGQNVV